MTRNFKINSKNVKILNIRHTASEALKIAQSNRI